jgi:3-oxoacyl-[acyl-carrier protein] reductase
VTREKSDMLENKIAFVTGCNRGIGKSVAEKFAENGATVYANARKEGSLDPLCNNEYSQGKIIPIYFDVTDREATRHAFMRIMKEQGRIDCLVNNAGILVDTLITMLDGRTLRDIYEVNVFAVFEMMSYASRIMSKQKSGTIVNITSICGDEGGMRGQTAYSSSKGAVIALTKTAAKELGGVQCSRKCCRSRIHRYGYVQIGS